jgi:hypothetical protein
MNNKVWHKITISMAEQDVTIFPGEGFDHIVIQTKEIDEKTPGTRLYINAEEAEFLILKMREMINYVKQ